MKLNIIWPISFWLMIFLLWKKSIVVNKTVMTTCKYQLLCSLNSVLLCVFFFVFLLFFKFIEDILLIRSWQHNELTAAFIFLNAMGLWYMFQIMCTELWSIFCLLERPTLNISKTKAESITELVMTYFQYNTQHLTSY